MALPFSNVCENGSVAQSLASRIKSRKRAASRPQAPQQALHVSTGSSKAGAVQCQGVGSRHGCDTN